jgi:predicted RNase H-like nuclease (RuvC/YqgF family)
MAGKTTTKKTSASSEIVFGQAAQQINKAVTELGNATSTINQLVSQVEELTLQISNKEAEIAELEVRYAEKARQAEVDFNLNIKANQERVVNEILRSNGMESISSAELKALRQELEATKANTDAEIKKQVAAATNAMKTTFENDLRFIQSENKAVAAENASKIGVLAEKNKFLEDQVTKLYLQLDAERAAGIERAKAGSIGNITVGDTNRK